MSDPESLKPLIRSPRQSKGNGKVLSKRQTLAIKDKIFLDGLTKSSNEKSLRMYKSSVPSYFNRHYRKNNDASLSLSKLETTVRFLSPQPQKVMKKNISTENTLNNFSPVVCMLQASNGIELYRVIDPVYKYFVGSGNNDQLIKKILHDKGWKQAYSPHSANLVWTDVKKSAICDLIPKGKVIKKSFANGNIISHPIFSVEYTALETTSILNPLKTKLYNKLEGNSELASKKKLFINMLNYYNSVKTDPFTVIPLTFHFINGSKDANFPKFLTKFKEIEEKIPSDEFLNNIWIVKPGEATNRGKGISICNSVQEVIASIDEKKVHNNIHRTYIVQKYLYRPLLYRERKFDIRCYTLVTILNNNIQAYFYKEGYIRTSCQNFDINNVHDKYVHLTNDAIQKNSPDYGKFEDGNKLSYSEFQEYINEFIENKVDFKAIVHAKMARIVKDTIKATYKCLDPNKRMHSFEILGYDFMVDQDFQPWLIEINTNPCLVLSGKYLAKLIPQMLQHSFEIVLDQLFPCKNPSFENNLYELIFSESK